MSKGPTPPIWLLPEPAERQWGLGRADIVRCAVELADAGGASALTMRAVANRLGASTPMSLYRYVHNKDGLVDLMLDIAMSEVSTPDVPGPDWRAELTAFAFATWEMTKRHPWYAELVRSRPPAGPNACRCGEFVLATFRRLGQDLSTALSYRRILENHIVGLAMQRRAEEKVLISNNFTSAEQVYELTRQWWAPEQVAKLYPNTAELMIDIRERKPDQQIDDQFMFGLDCLLDGISARI